MKSVSSSESLGSTGSTSDCEIYLTPHGNLSTPETTSDLTDPNIAIHNQGKKLSLQKLDDIGEQQIIAFFALPTSESITQRGHCRHIRGDKIYSGCLFVTNQYVCFYTPLGRYACPTLKGYLNHKSLLGTKRMWFLLQRGMLYYTQHENHPISSSTGISLRGATVSKDTKLLNGLVLSTNNKRVVLEADNDVQLNEWIFAMDTSIRSLKDKLRYGRIIIPIPEIIDMDASRECTLVIQLNQQEFRFETNDANESCDFSRSILAAIQELSKEELCNPLESSKMSLHDSLDWEDMNKQESLSRVPHEFMQDSPMQQHFVSYFDVKEIARSCIPCNLIRVLEESGTIFLTDLSFYFAAATSRISIPLIDIQSVEKLESYWSQKVRRIRVTTTKGSEYIFKFPGANSDKVVAFAEKITASLSKLNKTYRSGLRTSQELEIIQKLEESVHCSPIVLPPHAPVKPLNITVLSIGTRGDVQPYIALGIRLQSEGHRVTIATHQEFKGFVTSYGLRFQTLPGNPRDLMELCTSKGMFTPTFMKMAIEKFMDLMDQLLWVSWQVCQGEDVIIEAPMIRAGVHISEKLQIPHFIAFTMPFSSTKEYANPFLSVNVPNAISSSFNKMSYFLIERMSWYPMRQRINRFREECCQLPPLGVNEGANMILDRNIPFLYCFSSAVVPKPLDWPDWVNICGYWMLDQTKDTNFEPPQQLVDFIEGGEKPVYVGFGSIVVEEPDVLWDNVYRGIVASGLRVVLCCGWAQLKPEIHQQIMKNKNIFCIESCPHDWLFPRMKAVCHHGGAGTTATGLISACPTFIVSFFGDQPFWGQRISELGVGTTIPFSDLSPENFASSLQWVCTSTKASKNVKKIAHKLQKEDGLENAVQHIYRYVQAFHNHTAECNDILSFLVSSVSVGNDPAIQCNIDMKTGQYEITIHGHVWLASSATSLHTQNSWFVSSPSSNNTLAIASTVVAENRTSSLFGSYTYSSILYTTGLTDFQVAWSIYHDFPMVEFTQTFPQGAEKTSLHDPFQVISSFPSFSLESDKSALPSLQTLTWQSLWDNGTMGIGLEHVHGGLEGGVPVVMWNQSESSPTRVAVLSPFSNYMVGYQVPKSRHPDEKSFACGLTGMLLSVPEAFEHSTILYFGNTVSGTLYEWGDVLLKKGNKTRQLHSDLATSSLGYWTDNGAYYYYHTLTDHIQSNYEQTMIAVSEYHKEQDLPVSYYQFDSWWYYKSEPGDGNCTLFDCGGGVLSWTPMPSIFPNGMIAIQEALGKPLILHNRYWAVNNNYSSEYEFVNGVLEALPVDDGFFPFLLAQAKSWNVVTYEQDWLVKQYSAMVQTQNNVHTAMNWLQQMGSAASNLGLSIQYCMPLPQFWLASSEIQAVTHSRVSDDYLHGTNQWNIGKTSMLVWSLGLYPFKDVMWTTGVQPGNPFHLEEANPDMEVIISVLTAGPVAFGDGIGYTNTSLIMSTCMKNGTILAASVPVAPIERYFGSNPPAGEIWSAYTDIGGYRWSYIISISLTDAYTIFPSDLKLSPTQDYFAWDYNDPTLTNVFPFNDQEPIVLDETPGGTVNGKQYFSFYRVAPTFPNGWTLIGEMDKIIAVSPIRIQSLSLTSEGFKVTFHLTQNESTTFVSISPSKQRMETECGPQTTTLFCSSLSCSCN